MQDTKNKTNNTNRGASKIGFFVVILVLFGIAVCLSLGYVRVAKSTVLRRTTDNLQVLTKHENMILKQLVESELDRLQAEAAIFGQLDSFDNIAWDNIMYDKENDIHTSVINDKGDIYTENGKTGNVAGKDYYRKAMAGATVVSDIVPKEGEDTINFAYPIYKGKKVIGVVCSEYTTDWFTRMSNVSRPKDRENSIVIREDGNILIGKIAGYHNFYRFLDSVPNKDRDEKTVFLEKMRTGIPFSMNYSKDGRSLYIYCSKTGIKDWYTVSFVLEQGYNTGLAEVEMQAYVFLIINLGLFLCALIVCLFLVREYKKETQESKRDALTGACNRELAKMLMAPALRWPVRKRKHACMFMDIDFFKKINDVYGHQEGDIALKQVADILQETVRKGDVVARFGGDEFCIWLKNIPNESKMLEIIEYIFYRIRKETKFTISMGIAMYPQNGINYEELVRRADEALYTAKRNGKDRYCFYKKG